MNEETQKNYRQEDCDYVVALLDTIANKIDGLRLGGVNFSFIIDDNGKMRMSGVQPWFTENQTDK